VSDATNNRFYREPTGVPHASEHGSYRDEFNTTADCDNGYRSAVRLAMVLMEKHHPAATGWKPAPDLLGVITQIDHLTADLVKPAERSDRFANDDAAKALYDTWSGQAGWVPWVERGNSLMQERARREVML
jgi:hypothetical protein